MSKTNRELLEDLRQELLDIESFTTGGEAEFMSDLRTQKAVIRSYEVIGEIVKRLPPALVEAESQVNWRQLIGFRNFLVHNYDLIILRYVWDAVEQLPALRSAVESMLASLPPEEDVP